MTRKNTESNGSHPNRAQIERTRLWEYNLGHEPREYFLENELMGRPANAIPHVVVEDCEIIKATDASLGSGGSGIIVVGAIRRFTSGRFFFAFFVSMNEMGISRQNYSVRHSPTHLGRSSGPTVLVFWETFALPHHAQQNAPQMAPTRTPSGPVTMPSTGPWAPGSKIIGPNQPAENATPPTTAAPRIIQLTGP